MPLTAPTAGVPAVPAGMLADKELIVALEAAVNV
jgi:hypothetical protein